MIPKKTMQIDRQLGRYLVQEDDSIAAALSAISDNKCGFVLCVDAHGLLTGMITDGDFRRWASRGDGPVDTSLPARTIANRDMLTVSADAPAASISAKFSERIRFIPLVDKRGRPVGIAQPRGRGFQIADRLIGADSPAFLIAEIGINHNGSFDLAKTLIEEAARAGADCAKFQMRDMGRLYHNAGDANDPREDLGSQYTLNILSRSALPTEQMLMLFDYCRECGLIPLCTPWEEASLKVLDDYGLPGLKVASADLTNHDLLRAMAATGRPLIVSTGMSTEAEIQETVRLLEARGAPFALLHCNSTYPAPFKDVNLRYLARLQELAGEAPIGYSGHERGYAVPIAAVALGAKVIEKHFTMDRSMEGNDHKVSLLPDEFAAMVQGVRNVEDAMGGGEQRRLTQGERMNRENLAKSVIAARDIAEGARIERSMLKVQSPGRGLQPNRIEELIGRPARRSLAAGDFFFASDLDGEAAVGRAFTFKRRWGVPVRYHDWRQLYEQAPSMDFLEFHFSFKDLEQEPSRFMQERLPCDLVTHSPDLFEGDHLLNLADADPEYRARSIRELQHAIDRSRELAEFFTLSGPVKVIASLGGFTKDRALDLAERAPLYERVAESLTKLDLDGVELLPQTLPPFPWYMGGQLYCNLFVDAEDTARFAHETGFRLCFDISHSKLTCNHRGVPFSAFVDAVAPVTGHLHVVDAEGVDGEGLQIGDGEIDFQALAERLEKHCPDATFIPEIWQGHKNGGEGFWLALDRLEGLL